MYRSLAGSLASFLLIVYTLQAQTPLSKPDTRPEPAPSVATTPATTPGTAPATAMEADDAEQPAEDWTTIFLAKSHLPISKDVGFLLNKVDLPGGCTRELQRLQWRQGDPIDLYIIRPPQEGKLPVVLFLYNYTYDTDLFRQDRWCDLTKRNHYVAVGFASALSWQRFHAPRPLGRWFVSELQEALASSSHDVQMVINYLETRSDLDAKTIAMFGQGSGGAIAVLAAAADPRIVALDLMDPWGDWPDWIGGSKQIPEGERAGYLKPEFLARVQNLDPVHYLPELAGRSIRMQQRTDDSITPAAARAKMAAAVSRPGQVTEYPNLAVEAKTLGPDGIVGWLGQQVSRHGSGSIAPVPSQAPADVTSRKATAGASPFSE